MNARPPRTELPLIAWGETRHAHRQRRLHNLRIALGAGSALLLLAIPLLRAPAPRLVWNASASAPIGLYAVSPGARPMRGDMVIARLPIGWRTLAAERHYLPANVPLVKRVAAVAGDRVCGEGPRILINGKVRALRAARDAAGRALPWWRGCRDLQAGDYLLLMDAPGSFDGRYFGLIQSRDLVGAGEIAMVPVTALLAAVLLGLAPLEDEAGVARWSAEIDSAAARCGVPQAWIVGVMQVESGGRTQLNHVPIRSPKGAIGLMQLMPGTWAEMRAALRLGDDPDLPADNIVAGACYLRRMYDRFGYPGLFAAYNAGPARYAAWLAGKASLPGETVAYLGATSGALRGAPAALPPRTDTLFALRRTVAETTMDSVAPVSGQAIFVLRRTAP